MIIIIIILTIIRIIAILIIMIIIATIYFRLAAHKQHDHIFAHRFLLCSFKQLVIMLINDLFILNIFHETPSFSCDITQYLLHMSA